MGTITPRTNADGSTSYKAQVRIRRGGKIVHQETQTFTRQQAAKAWAKKRETELAQPGGISAATAEDPPLGAIIARYLEESQKELGDTKRRALEMLKESPVLSPVKASEVTANTLIQWAQSLNLAPATVAGYISHLKAVFKIAKPAWGYALSKVTIVEALDVLNELGVTGSSIHRDRRPSLTEMSNVLSYLRGKRMRRPDACAHDIIVLFAALSSRRQGEITRIKWTDIDEENSRLLVFDMKDPKKKKGNHVWLELPYEALRLLRAAPRFDDTYVFPYSNILLYHEFIEACDFHEVKDLVFHDLRHEAISHLFEIGKSIPQVAMVSGHKTWGHLKRYAHIRAFGDKYAGWEWLDIIAPLPQLPLGHLRPHN